MNILQILPELNYGGVETGVLDFSKYLVEHNHKVVVVCNGGALVEELKTNGIIYYEFPVDKKSPFSIFKTIPQLVEIIKKEKIDIVHARSRVPAWIGYFAARKTRTTFITTAHGYYSKHLFSRAMGWGKLIIAPSKIIARHMVESFGVPYERIRIIPRGVNLKRFEFILPSSKKHPEMRIGIIARLSPIKGHSYFLRAMAKIVRAKPFIKIWVVGDAKKGKENYKEELIVLARRLGLGHCIEFLGIRRDIPQILNQLDINVLPTITQEAFGRAILESQAAGVPVVATSVGGIVDVIEDKITGLLVPVRDVESLTNSILSLMEDKNLCDTIAKNARKKAEERFTLEIMAEKTLDIYQEALKIFNILVIKLTSIGDVVLISPSLRALRKKFPQAKISCLTMPQSMEILLNCPYIDEVIIYDTKNKHKGLKGFWQIAKDLQKRNFDISIDFQNNRKSHILGFLSLSFLRYGYANKKFDFLLNMPTLDIKNIGPVEHQFQTLKNLDIELENPHLEMWPSKEDENYIQNFLESNWALDDKLIGINLGASLKWQAKTWPVEYIAEFAQLVSQKGLRLVITGTNDDLILLKPIKESLQNSKAIIACGKTSINQLACLIKRCRVFISSDSAPLHVACSTNTPCIALFGPTDPKRHTALNENLIILKKDLPCSPCYKPRCKTKDCLRQITPKEVLEKTEELLSKSR